MWQPNRYSHWQPLQSESLQPLAATVTCFICKARNSNQLNMPWLASQQMKAFIHMSCTFSARQDSSDPWHAATSHACTKRTQLRAHETETAGARCTTPQGQHSIKPYRAAENLGELQHLTGCCKEIRTTLKQRYQAKQAEKEVSSGYTRAAKPPNICTPAKEKRALR